MCVASSIARETSDAHTEPEKEKLLTCSRIEARWRLAQPVRCMSYIIFDTHRGFS